MAKQTFSVDVPVNPDELITLADKILAKDSELGANSPFKNIRGWSTFAALNTTADTNHKDSKKYAQMSVEATQSRDLALGQSGQLKENTVRWFVTSARDILQGLNKGNEQKLGEYGFEVTYGSPGSSAKKKAKKPDSNPPTS